MSCASSCGTIRQSTPVRRWKQVSDFVVARQRLQQVVHHGQLLAGERGWIDTERHLPSACAAPEARVAGAHNSSASIRPPPRRCRPPDSACLLTRTPRGSRRFRARPPRRHRRKPAAFPRSAGRQPACSTDAVTEEPQDRRPQGCSGLRVVKYGAKKRTADHRADSHGRRVSLRLSRATDGNPRLAARQGLRAHHGRSRRPGPDGSLGSGRSGRSRSTRDCSAAASTAESGRDGPAASARGPVGWSDCASSPCDPHKARLTARRSSEGRRRDTAAMPPVERWPCALCSPRRCRCRCRAVFSAPGFGRRD